MSKPEARLGATVGERIADAYYEARKLVCVDCGQPFIFTAGEQAYFAEREFEDPKRCKGCRADRKLKKQDGAAREPEGERPAVRDLHDAVCTACGAQTSVPFLPRRGRPVLCRPCYRGER